MTEPVCPIVIIEGCLASECLSASGDAIMHLAIASHTWGRVTAFLSAISDLTFDL